MTTLNLTPVRAGRTRPIWARTTGSSGKVGTHTAHHMFTVANPVRMRQPMRAWCRLNFRMVKYLCFGIHIKLNPIMTERYWICRPMGE